MYVDTYLYMYIYICIYEPQSKLLQGGNIGNYERAFEGGYRELRPWLIDTYAHTPPHDSPEGGFQALFYRS